MHGLLTRAIFSLSLSRGLWGGLHKHVGVTNKSRPNRKKGVVENENNTKHAIRNDEIRDVKISCQETRRTWRNTLMGFPFLITSIPPRSLSKHSCFSWNTELSVRSAYTDKSRMMSPPVRNIVPFISKCPIYKGAYNSCVRLSPSAESEPEPESESKVLCFQLSWISGRL